jgi:hypothetical protein
MIKTLFPNNDAVFQEDSAFIHTARNVWFSHGLKSMKVNFNIFPGQQNHQILNVIEPLCSVLMRNRFPSPASLKQLENVLQEEWYKILLGTI